MRATAPGQSAVLLLDTIDVLNKRGIPYAIVGAFAASFYGVVRASLDADAVISAHTAQDIADLCADLRAQQLTVTHRRGDRNDPIAAVIDIEDRFHNKVDLLIGIRGTTAEIFQRTKTARFKGSAIKIVSPEDFIALKIFAGSPRDIQDAEGVLAVSRKSLDIKLLKKLTSQYGRACAKKLATLLKS